MIMLLVLVVMAIMFGGGALASVAMMFYFGYITAFAAFTLSGYDALGVGIVTGIYAIAGAVGTLVGGRIFFDVCGSIHRQFKLMVEDRKLRHRQN